MNETNSVSPLRQRMIEDMAARKLNPHTQRSHVYSCKRFAAWLKRSPDTATPDEVRRFQLYLIESGASICNRGRKEAFVDAADIAAVAVETLINPDMRRRALNRLRSVRSPVSLPA
jgi:hypothetical protein